MEEKPGKIRVVIDTNIYISFSKRGYYRRILELWLEERFELVTSNEILEELRITRIPHSDFLFHQSVDLVWLKLDYAVE